MKAMSISVIYLDGTLGEVSNDVLDVLIATGRISKFKRTDGWVDVGGRHNKLRDYLKPGKYQGQDRRAPWPNTQQKTD
ncbi:MAG TPA: hypothetical protein VIR78_10105 [Malonomonas sp.]